MVGVELVFGRSKQEPQSCAGALRLSQASCVTGSPSSLREAGRQRSTRCLFQFSRGSQSWEPQKNEERQPHFSRAMRASRRALASALREDVSAPSAEWSGVLHRSGRYCWDICMPNQYGLGLPFFFYLGKRVCPCMPGKRLRSGGFLLLRQPHTLR